MRIVVFPMYSNAVNMSGCSTVNFYKDLIMSWLNKHEDLFVYFVLPKEDVEHNRWVWNAGPFEHKRLKKLPMKYEHKQYNQICVVTQEWFDLFNESHGKYYYDIILTEHYSLVPLIRSISSGYVRANSARTPVITYCGFLMDSVEDNSFIPDWMEMAQVIGMYGATANVFPSGDVKKRAVDMCRRYLQFSKVKNIEDKMRSIPPSVNFVYIDDCTKDSFRDPKKLTLNFSGRTTEGYKFEDAAEIMNYVFTTGHDVKVIVNTPSGKVFDDNDMKNKCEWMEINEGAGRGKFLQEVAKCDVFIFCTICGEAPITIIEQLYCGVIGIFKYTDEILAFLPEWYPKELFFNNKYEALASIKWFMDRFGTDYIEEFRKKLKAFIVDRYSVGNDNLYDLIENVYRDHVNNEERDKYKFTCTSGVVELVSDAIKNISGMKFTMEGLRDVVESMSRTGIDILKPNKKTGLNKMVFYQQLKRAGCRDFCSEENPIFVKSV